MGLCCHQRNGRHLSTQVKRELPLLVSIFLLKLFNVSVFILMWPLCLILHILVNIRVWYMRCFSSSSWSRCFARELNLFFFLTNFFEPKYSIYRCFDTQNCKCSIARNSLHIQPNPSQISIHRDFLYWAIFTGPACSVSIQTTPRFISGNFVDILLLFSKFPFCIPSIGDAKEKRKVYHLCLFVKP